MRVKRQKAGSEYRIVESEFRQYWLKLISSTTGFSCYTVKRV